MVNRPDVHDGNLRERPRRRERRGVDPFSELLFREVEVLHEGNGRENRCADADLGNVLFDLVLAVEVRNARLSVGGADGSEDEMHACCLRRGGGGDALFTRGSRNNDCELLRHVLLPFSCGQARGSRRDWNNPEKAGRTSMKITAHSTATKKASGSPLGAIKAWKVRMLTITGASTATANGTYRLASKSTPAM